MLAIATGTGLAAPLLALDGLPPQLLPPDHVQWDALGEGSLTAAAATVRMFEQDAAPAWPSLEDIHRQLATPWVRAAGVDGTGPASDDELAAAGGELGVAVTGADPASLEALRSGVLEQARDTVRALGLERPDQPMTPGVLEQAAAALGVARSGPVTPAVVEEVVDAGREVVADHLDRTVTPYAEALGLPVGERPDPGVTRAVAAELGVDVPDVPDESAAAAIHHAWLQSLRPAFDQLGLDPRARVDPVDLVALGRALGADVGAGTSADDVTRLLPALRESAAVPPRIGTIAGAVLHVPSHDALLSGWHEAAGPSALPMQPAPDGPWSELPSRGRPQDPHSALDVAVAPGTVARAPVTGTVVEVSPYLLYGDHPDTRIVIRPDDAPHLAVHVLHVTGPLVTAGDHVTPGRPIAREATQFPFLSQIEEQTGRAPHIHLEVKAAAP